MRTEPRSKVRAINSEHVNNRYLSKYTLSPLISATTVLEEAVHGADLIILTIPAQNAPDFLRENRDTLPRDVLVCSTAKGLYLETKQLLSKAMQDALGREQPMCFLSGPSFAKEIMKGFPTAVVVASRPLYHAVRVQRLLSSLSFRIYTSQDTVGVELGGALKNPLAIGAGIIEGSGLGVNTMAAYVTRSSNELKRLCVAMGGEPDTIMGLAGIGDLMLTAFGNLSRNRSLGIRVAQGESVEEICKDYTVEGVPTAKVAVYYAEACGLDLPLFRTVAAILEGQIRPADARGVIMGRPLKQEM
jgi:glycerol-3-phosphate dehydrogenase (NAD+)